MHLTPTHGKLFIWYEREWLHKPWSTCYIIELVNICYSWMPSLFSYNKHLEGEDITINLLLKYGIDFLFHWLHQKNQEHCLFLKFPKMQVVFCQIMAIRLKWTQTRSFLFCYVLLVFYGIFMWLNFYLAFQVKSRVIICEAFIQSNI